MKRLITTQMLLAIGMMATAQVKTPVTEFNLAGPYAVSAPFAIDTVDVQGKKFDPVSQLGKADPGAHLYAGFKQQITPYEYQKRIEDGTITEVLADHQVKAGDVFYLPAGRVHAICGGILLAEVQQSSDVTYRIFDYNRPGLDGKPRELHTALAAQALDFHVEANYRTVYPDTTNRAVQIIDTPFFDVRVMEIDKPKHRDMRKYDSFVISMCLEGDCEIRLRPSVTSDLSPLTSHSSPLILKAGHSTLIPAAIADYDVIPLHGKSKILDAFIDNQDNLGDKITKFLHIGA